MDGTIYKGGTLFDFTKPFLAQIRDLGIGFTFLTNNSSKSVPDYIAHLERFGIDARLDQLFTSGLASVEFLRANHPEFRRLFILGTESLRMEFSDAGFVVVEDSASDEPDAVVVGFDMELTYRRLCMASYWISRGKPFIATNPDCVCPTDQETVLVDCGALCACIESATGCSPDIVLGKPHPSMLDGILARHGLMPQQLAMVGDRQSTDMAMAKTSGALGVLVLTGEATAKNIRSDRPHPFVVVSDLSDLGELLRKAADS